MVEHDVLIVFQAVLHLFPKTLLLNIVGTVKIRQVQVSRAPFPHALRF